jgi:hypothetical protein
MTTTVSDLVAIGIVQIADSVLEDDEIDELEEELEGIDEDEGSYQGFDDGTMTLIAYPSLKNY